MTQVLTETSSMLSKMAKRYKDAWQYLLSLKSEWARREISKEPFGRMAQDLAHEVALLAEKNEEIPIPVLKSIGKK